MAARKVVVVFVHGWGVTSTVSYGSLPDRLREDAKSAGLNIVVKDVFLGRYISFHDEVQLSDIARAFHSAVEEQVAAPLKGGRRFICITHSTGGPIVRDWWNRYYESVQGSSVCPMSHLIMLAPANFGSALAQLGKRRLGRLKSWFGGVEPGQAVLDWLELGSNGSWDLNKQWITSSGKQIGARGLFPFVLTGQSIDRAFYDHLNTYTGERGSDGVVRVAAANLNSAFIQLVQEKPKVTTGANKFCHAPRLRLRKFEVSPSSAFCVLRGKSHSGPRMGIMRSVKKSVSDRASEATIDAILSCIAVNSKSQYAALTKKFHTSTHADQRAELLEVDTRTFRSNTHFVHDRCSMVVFRVRDVEGNPVTDFELILTAGPDGDPNHLPKGFLADRQRNSVSSDTITLYFNYDIMVGSEAVVDQMGNVIRPATSGAGMLGLRIQPRPDKGFVRYMPCEVKASKDLLQKVLQPNCTTLVEIRLQRVVSRNVFRMNKVKQNAANTSFRYIAPGDKII